MPLSRDEQILKYGWTALLYDPSQCSGNKKNNHNPTPQLYNQVPSPETPLIKAAMEHVKAKLPEHTFNHCMRVSYDGSSPSNLLLP
jgi:cyanamide hydratase